MSYDEGDAPFDEEAAAEINERLTRVGIPQLSGHEQIQLVDIVECVGLVEKQRRSLDENGARFMLFFRQHALRKGRTNEIHMGWREINWAYHSTSQDVLVDFVSKQSHGRMLWENARESGIFMWLSDNAAVVRSFVACGGKGGWLTRGTESPVRGDCAQRVHQERAQEPHRLQSLLSCAQKEDGPAGAVAHGDVEPGAGRDAAVPSEQL